MPSFTYYFYCFRLLVKYFDCTKSGSAPHVLVPLCGKTVDMKWLADQGCYVTGVELAEDAMKQFLVENELSAVESEPAAGIKLFEAYDGKIKLYQCDIFDKGLVDLNRECFDIVWDRGAFVAINVEDRQKYVEFLQLTCKPSVQILLVAMEYDPDKWPGPPHYATKSDVEKSFSNFNVNFLETSDAFEPDKHGEGGWGLEWITESLYKIEHK